MLINNKFIYLSLPRCASTSFHATCLQLGISVDDYTNPLNSHLSNVDIKDKSIDWLADNMRHGHYSVSNLQRSYGTTLPIISVNRDRHDRFISLWKHCIDEMYRNNEIEVANFCSNLEYHQLLNFKSNEIYDRFLVNKVVERICKDNGLNNISNYAKWGIGTCITPYSTYHQHNPNIKWFDFTNLSEMEEWVSNILGLDFKLGNGNSSNTYKCKLELNDEFISKYNDIYDIYDNRPTTKKII